jgi:hypothetical protein
MPLEAAVAVPLGQTLRISFANVTYRMNRGSGRGAGRSPQHYKIVLRATASDFPLAFSKILSRRSPARPRRLEQPPIQTSFVPCQPASLERDLLWTSRTLTLAARPRDSTHMPNGAQLTRASGGFVEDSGHAVAHASSIRQTEKVERPFTLRVGPYIS